MAKGKLLLCPLTEPVPRATVCLQDCKQVPAAVLLSVVEQCGGALLELDLQLCTVRGVRASELWGKDSLCNQ